MMRIKKHKKQKNDFLNFKEILKVLSHLLFKDNFLVKVWVLFLLIFTLSFIFSNFFTQVKDDDYEAYIDIEKKASSSWSENITNDESQKIDYNEIVEELRQKAIVKDLQLSSATNIDFLYNPADLESELLSNSWVTDISQIVFSKLFDEKNLNFNIEFNKNKIDVRWKYKDDVIKLFWVLDLNEEEMVSVFIHELGHYFDINFLEKKVLFDVSDNFYDISWKSVTVLRDWSDKKDFVSWYAMTNKYEDFAETFTYYVLFNDDFRQKMSYNPKLQEKYNFFSKYIFRNNEFMKTNFRIEKNLEDYYWDITKIKISLANFLEYLKNWV